MRFPPPGGTCLVAMLPPMSSLAVWIVGAAGNVGACVLAGWAAVRDRALPPTGLCTTTDPFAQQPLVGFGDVAFGGHELGDRSLDDSLRRLIAEQILPAALA